MCRSLSLIGLGAGLLCFGSGLVGLCSGFGHRCFKSLHTVVSLLQLFRVLVKARQNFRQIRGCALSGGVATCAVVAAWAGGVASMFPARMSSRSTSGSLLLDCCGFAA